VSGSTSPARGHASPRSRRTATPRTPPALAKAGFVWDARSLERWIADPESVVPGQRMGFRVNDASERADIVAFLLTLKP